MPNASAHIPDDSPLWEQIKKRAETDYNGKISAYVREVIERDLAGETGPINSKTIMVDIARQLLGEPAAENMEILCPEPMNQAHELRRLIADYMEHEEANYLTVQEGSEPYGLKDQAVELQPLFHRVKNPDHILNPKKPAKKRKA